jgi:capsular polysaccharide biosynthesis protein
MEIVDYLQVAKRRLRVLILIPVIATLAAVAYVVLAPVTYTANATVSTSTLVGAPWSQYTGPQGVNQFAAEFKATATSPTVLDAAAAASGVSVGELKSSISVAQVGASSNMTLTYTGHNQQEAKTAAQEVTAQALSQMFEPQVEIASSQAGDAQQAVSTVNQSIATLGAKNGTPDPVSSYQAALQELGYYQQSQANLRAKGQFSQADSLSSSVHAVQKTLRSFGPILQQYNTLLAQQQAAAASLSVAREDFRRASAGAAAATSPTVFSVGEANATSRIGSGVRIVIPVLGAAVFLAILVILLLELVVSARGRRPEPEVFDGSPAHAPSSDSDAVSPAVPTAPPLPQPPPRAWPVRTPGTSAADTGAVSTGTAVATGAAVSTGIAVSTGTVRATPAADGTEAEPAPSRSDFFPFDRDASLDSEIDEMEGWLRGRDRARGGH